jgi:hypothetical protein
VKTLRSRARFLSAMDTLTVALIGAFLLSLPILLTMQHAATNLQRPIIKDSPEVLEPITAPFVGQLPSWMNGTLFRIGKYASHTDNHQVRHNLTREIKVPENSILRGMMDPTCISVTLLMECLTCTG